MDGGGFDRIADRYDETRGGAERGRRVAGPLSDHLDPGSPVLEIGVGTGLIAAALVQRGFRLLGVDLSGRMLARARTRLGPRVAQGDALRLPIRDRSVHQAIAVWALHVIGDAPGALREVARVLRPGGRLVVVNSVRSDAEDPFGGLLVDMQRGLDPYGGRDDSVERLSSLAGRAGLRVGSAEHLRGVMDATAADVLHSIRTRSYSILWDVDDEAWEAHVRPVLEALERLPADVRAARHSLGADLVVLEHA